MGGLKLYSLDTIQKLDANKKQIVGDWDKNDECNVLVHFGRQRTNSSIVDPVFIPEFSSHEFPVIA